MSTHEETKYLYPLEKYRIYINDVFYKIDDVDCVGKDYIPTFGDRVQFISLDRTETFYWLYTKDKNGNLMHFCECPEEFEGFYFNWSEKGLRKEWTANIKSM